VARRTAAEACFIDIEACTLGIFDAIRRPFAIGHNAPDLDRVLHLRCEVAARRAVIPNYMHFLSQLEMWVCHRESPPRGSQQRIPQWQEDVEPRVWPRVMCQMVRSRRSQHWWQPFPKVNTPMHLFNRDEVNANARNIPGAIPRRKSKSAITTGTPLIAKRATTQIGELPRLTCSASVGVPTDAWCSRCRRPKNVLGKCRRNKPVVGVFKQAGPQEPYSKTSDPLRQPSGKEDTQSNHRHAATQNCRPRVYPLDRLAPSDCRSPSFRGR
jgi:hypothetical protein